MAAVTENSPLDTFSSGNSCPPASGSINQEYTKALLRGRHPRSFPLDRGIFQYIKESNNLVNSRQRGTGLARIGHRQGGRAHSPDSQHDLDHSGSCTSPPRSIGTISTCSLSSLRNNYGVQRQVYRSSPPAVHGGPLKRKQIAAQERGRYGTRGRFGSYSVHWGHRKPGQNEPRRPFVGEILSRAANESLTEAHGSHGGLHHGPGSPTIHQRFKAMMGIHREHTSCDRDSVEDSLNNDASLLLHYGLLVTLQAVQGEDGSFVALDMNSGEVTMQPLRGLEKHQKVTFKLIDLEDPASFRSILYGRSVWLQILPGPGEPTWKQGSVLGARVHGPGILPTVVMEMDEQPASKGRKLITAGQTGGHKKSTSTGNGAPGQSLEGRGSPSGEKGSGSGGAGVCSGAADDVVRPGSAGGGGNMERNRHIGVPYPFKAAAPKPGDGSGSMNETFVRLMNKSAVVNCRWIVRPVHPNGKSKPGKMGHEVANMDYVYFEQDFFYMTRVNQSNRVALKALQQKASVPGKGKRGGHQKQFPVERRGIFRLQVSDADELGRPGGERSAALMRKAKKGLKRSEAVRGGHQVYVHHRRQGDLLTSGAAFPREIRLHTSQFSSDSESKAMSRQGLSRGRRDGTGGDDGIGGLSKRMTREVSPNPMKKASSTKNLHSPWLGVEWWAGSLTAEMSTDAHAPVLQSVTARHAKTLREWRSRWGGPSVSLSIGGAGKCETKTGPNNSVTLSPICWWCKFAEPGGKRFCLCALNRDIQMQVIEDCTKHIDPHQHYCPPKGKNAAHSGDTTNGVRQSTQCTTVDSEEEPRPASAAPSAKSSSKSSGGDGVVGVDDGTGAGGGSLGSACVAGISPRGTLHKTLERRTSLGVTGLVAAGAGAMGGPGVPSKRARDRRADRKKKKDPFHALEERLLDTFSLERIMRQLCRQDETILKGEAPNVPPPLQVDLSLRLSCST